ncbi:hypothetical protein EDD11_009158 [Mortierella claussenii]|nr:hypothetical protein EDD11_009158 [Mortierella claussenii]
MSIAPSIPVDTSMATANSFDASTRQQKNNLSITSDSSSSPPVTPPTKSSGPDAGSVMRSSLPSPPPSSSSRHSRAPDHHHPDTDQRDLQLMEGDHHHRQSIDRIARRLSHTAAGSTSSRPPLSTTSGAPAKTHSSSSSTSSSTSGHHHPPPAFSNKHVAVTKTKSLGHLTRSTSSEVDNEVAHALASGRSIVSKTDWKEEDAQYLVQLIEAQFPKGNIIWDWVGQQMTSRGFTKSQCRSKWKRIRTKVLHGSDAPNPSGKDRDFRDQHREQEHDELMDDEDEDMAEARHDHGSSSSSHWQQRQQQQSYDQNSEVTGFSDSYHRSHPYESREQYDRPHEQQQRGDGYYYNDDYRSRSSPGVPAAPPTSSSHSRRVSSQYYGHHPGERGGGPVEEDELWSDDEGSHRGGHEPSGKRYSLDYASPVHHHRRQSSIHHHQQPSLREDAESNAGDDAMTTRTAIAATPTSFGKIEWKSEDSDYLVHLIETKFASRKVDWAWVSKQMEGRGYDRTQCKSRWWRVQHRQNQGSQHHASTASHLGSTSLPSSRNNKHQQRQSMDQAGGESRDHRSANDKQMGGSEGESSPRPREKTTRPSSANDAEHDSVPFSSETDRSRARQLADVDQIKEKALRDEAEEEEEEEVRPGARGRRGKSGAAEESAQGTSPRKHEHQKHIEWKEEDSQYMYRLIEREFPVGNVVWSVIGEKMQSRGYSQTQCMSKWRRHLKNNKMPTDAAGASHTSGNHGGHSGGNNSKTGLSMDMDVELDSISNDPLLPPRLTSYRRRAGHSVEDRLTGSYTTDPYAEAGAKRFRRDGLDMRSSRSDRGASMDFRSVDPLDARLVEMEYDRYYDAGGKRKRIDGDDSGLVPPSDTGYGHHHQPHHRHHHSQHDSQPHRSQASPHGDYNDYEEPSGKYHPREYYDQGEDVYSRSTSARRTSLDNHRSDPPVPTRPYRDETYNRRRPLSTAAGHYGPEDDAVLDVEEPLSKSARREPYSSGRYHSRSPIDHEREPHHRLLTDYPEQHHRSSERHDQHHHQHHRHRSSSVASSAHREPRLPLDIHDAAVDAYGTTGGADSSAAQRQEQGVNKEPQHRPLEPEREPVLEHELEHRQERDREHEQVQERKQDETRGRAIVRSPERGLVGRRRSVSRPLARPPRDYDYADADRARDERHQYRTASGRVGHNDYDNHELPLEDRHQHPGSGRHHHSTRPLSQHQHQQHRQRSRPLQHSQQEFDSRESSDFIDYAMEDDLEWAAGRWESRDMARLAAAVARQGRRWDAIRAQIRMPVLVSPLDDEEYYYDGMDEDGFRMFESPHYPEESRRLGRHHASASQLKDYHHHRHRPSSSIGGAGGSVYHRSSAEHKHRTSVRGPVSTSLELEKRPYKSSMTNAQRYPTTYEEEVADTNAADADLTMEEPPELDTLASTTQRGPVEGEAVDEEDDALLAMDEDGRRSAEGGKMEADHREERGDGALEAMELVDAVIEAGEREAAKAQAQAEAQAQAVIDTEALVQTGAAQESEQEGMKIEQQQTSGADEQTLTAESAETTATGATEASTSTSTTTIITTEMASS